jgi:hypothetical protein
MKSLAAILPQKISLAVGIILFAFGAVYFSRISLFSGILGYGGLFTSFQLFEQHFWNFFFRLLPSSFYPAVICGALELIPKTSIGQ